MSQVHIEIESGWRWIPDQPRQGQRTVEVPAELLERYRHVAAAFYELQEYLEHAFRAQEGLTPFENSPFA